MGVKFTGKAQRSLNRALDTAKSLGHTYVGTEHLLYGILAEGDSVAAGVLAGVGMTSEKILEIITKTAGRGEKSEIDARDMTPGLKSAIENAARLSSNTRCGYIGTEHILSAMLTDCECFASRLISAEGKSIAGIKNELAPFVGGEGGKVKNVGEKHELRSMPMLMRYGKDLVGAAENGRLDPLIGREKECERVMQILSRRTKNNPCLVGDAGVGKTAIAEGIAALIFRQKVPEILASKRIVSLDVPSMIAGAKYRGEFEERMKGVMEEVSKNKNIILFVDEIHTIVGAGAAEGAVDAANIIKPALSRGDLQMIGATTADEYRKYIEKDAALERRFQPVTVEEPDSKQTIRILKGLRDIYEAHHGLIISDEAINAAVELSVRYIRDRRLPDKAIDLIDEASSRVRMRMSKKPEEIGKIEEKITAASAEKKEAILSEDYEAATQIRDTERELVKAYRERSDKLRAENYTGCQRVTERDIAEVVEQWMGVPVSDKDREELADLEKTLLKETVGQKKAVLAVASAIKRGRAGLKDPTRPIACFLFLGPTGVGKTELTKQLSKALFSNTSKAVRFDMSEYSEKHSISKLIGSPPGYVGYDEGGELTEAVRRNPYCTVVFDEAEKAHPAVLNLLLQIMDEGKLCDSSGHEVDFRNTIIILTSNIGGTTLTAKVKTGFSENDVPEKISEAENEVRREVKKVFSPEFLNRIDEIVVFKPLTSEDAVEITKRLLCELSKRSEKTPYTVSFDNKTAQNIVNNFYKEEYGARSLKRAVVTYVESVIADVIVSGKYPPNTHIVCTVDENGKTNVTSGKDGTVQD